MSRSLFRYIWRHSRRDQLIIFMVVIASLPFFYVSLDLPRRIVNEAIQGKAFDKGRMTAPFLEFSVAWPDWLGGGHHVQIFPGFQVGRLELLFGLSALFLFFVLVNGWFKYWINVAKGALGERMMRRMRFELFSFAMRFTPEALRTVKSSEAATIIKDEVEPIGGFIGDAFHPAGVPGDAGRHGPDVHPPAERVARVDGRGGGGGPVRRHSPHAPRIAAPRPQAANSPPAGSPGASAR